VRERHDASEGENNFLEETMRVPVGARSALGHRAASGLEGADSVPREEPHLPAAAETCAVYDASMEVAQYLFEDRCSRRMGMGNRSLSSLEVAQLLFEDRCSGRTGVGSRSKFTASRVFEPVAPLPGEPAPMKAEIRVPQPADLLALRIPSQLMLEAAAARSRTQAPGTADSVTQTTAQRK
jgi:hypothetical protein